LLSLQLDGDGSRKTHFARSKSSYWTDYFLEIQTGLVINKLHTHCPSHLGCQLSWGTSLNTAMSN
jgi:hypothetical protein